LKIIDFCLGDDDSARNALGQAVADRYVEFELVLSLNGAEHRLNRSLDPASRRMTKIRVDDEFDLTPRELSDWLLVQLEWPRIQVPLGRNALTATQMTPLTMRALLRHIYRREESWLTFASEEEEFLRRAVTSLFLGLAESRYSGEEFRLGQAERDLQAAEAAARESGEGADAAIGAVMEQLGLPAASRMTLPDLEERLTTDLQRIVAERDRLGSTPQREDGWDPELGERYGDVCTELERIRAREADLSQAISAYDSSVGLVRSHMSRLDRLFASAGAFDEIPATMCPACEQKVDPGRPHQEELCYLCGQGVQVDLRHRRIAAERRSLERELEDLDDVLVRSRIELGEIRRLIEMHETVRADLAMQLNDARGGRLAPFVRQLEDLASGETQIRQQLAALRGLEHFAERVASADRAVSEAASKLDGARAAFAAVHVDTREAINRCATFADRMNSFLSRFRQSVWLHHDVTLSEDDFTFYVGTRPWDQALGAEARVIFFLAYGYALLCLDTDLPNRGNGPGTLLLDNPYQQGVADDVIRTATDLLSGAADIVGAQVVLTAARAPALTSPHRLIAMTESFDA